MQKAAHETASAVVQQVVLRAALAVALRRSAERVAALQEEVMHQYSEAHERGEETSLNPLGMIEALIGAMNHSADLAGGAPEVLAFTSRLRVAVHTLLLPRARRAAYSPGSGPLTQFL